MLNMTVYLLSRQLSLWLLLKRNHSLCERCVGEGDLIHWSGRSGWKNGDRDSAGTTRSLRMTERWPWGWVGRNSTSRAGYVNQSWSLWENRHLLEFLQQRECKAGAWLYGRERCWKLNLGWGGKAETVIGRKPLSPLLEGTRRAETQSWDHSGPVWGELGLQKTHSYFCRSPWGSKKRNALASPFF